MTPRLSSHARARAAEMGLSTKAIKRAVRHPDFAYPADAGATISVAGELAVVHQNNLVITVLWAGKEGR